VSPSLIEPLSERELQVLRLLAAGKPNQQIAQELVVSLHTVKKHVTHVLGSLARPTVPRGDRPRPRARLAAVNREHRTLESVPLQPAWPLSGLPECHPPAPPAYPPTSPGLRGFHGYCDHGDRILTQQAPFGSPAGDRSDPHVAAMRSAEQQAFTAPRG
jgi:hypothetical protein